MRNRVHFLQATECSAEINLEGNISLESLSRYCLALMSNWNISGCLPWNVILYCALGTLDEKTQQSKVEGSCERMLFPTFHKHELMSH